MKLFISITIYVYYTERSNGYIYNLSNGCDHGVLITEQVID